MIDTYKKIWTLLGDHKKKDAWQLLFLMVLMAFMEVLGVGSIMPFLAVLGNPEIIETNKYFSSMYNFLNFEDKNNFLLFLGGFALFMLLLSAVVRSLTSYAKFRFSNLRRHSISQKLLKNYLYRPYSFFLSRNSSDISKVILSETDLAIGQSINPSLNLLTHIILLLTIAGFLVVVDPILTTILALVFGGFYTIMYLSVRKYLAKIGQIRNKANTERFKIAAETIGGIKDLKVLGREKIYLDSFTKPSYEFSHYHSINQTISELPQYIVEVLAFGMLIVMSMYVLAYESKDITIVLPILGIYALAALKLKPVFNGIYNAMAMIKFGSSAIDNIIEDMQNTNFEDIIELRNNHKRIELKDKLILKNISFIYPNTKTFVLKNINIEIKANTTLGIIGATGAGKSTFIDMILGLLPPLSGKIFVDEKELNNGNIRQWQNSIGYVPQSIFLADDTIANNIAFGIEKDAIDIKQVEQVAKMAQVNEFVCKLEKGYDTIIGERGVRLSGGQRQRLGIARALYHNPELLVLDEATSALDNQTEVEVMKAIDNMSGSKTIIIIAHRLSTIERCNKVIRLENGEIFEK